MMPPALFWNSIASNLLGEVSYERQRQIKARIREILRLLEKVPMPKARFSDLLPQLALPEPIENTKISH